MSSGFGVPKMDWSPLQAIGQQLTINAELERQRQLEREAAGLLAGQINALGTATPGAPVAPVAASPVAPGFGGGTSAARADGSPINSPAGPAARALQQASTSAKAVPVGLGGDIENKFVGALKEGGLTNPYGLAAVAAYANHESRYSPRNIIGSWNDPSESGQAGTSGGILSWRDDRFANMRKATAGASDPVVAQAQFTLRENPALTQALQNAKSPEEAHKLMADAWRFAGYNRPGGENAARLNSTREYVGRVAGIGAPQQVPAPGGAPVAQPMRPQAPVQVAALGNVPGLVGALGGQPQQPAPQQQIPQQLPPQQVAQAGPAPFVPGQVVSPALESPSGPAGGPMAAVAPAQRVTPERLEYLRRAAANPLLRQSAQAEVAKLSAPVTYEVKVVGDQAVRIGSDGSVTPLSIPQKAAYKIEQLGDGARVIFDPRTGQARALSPGESKNYRTLADEEKAQHGYGPNDIVQVGPDGKHYLPNKAQTQIDIGNKADSAGAIQASKLIMDRFDAVGQEGQAARNDVALVGELRALGNEIGTGGVAALQSKLGEYGIKFEGSGKVEAYNALVDRLTPQQRVPGAGATSDFDAKMFKGSLPRLINTPEGNALIADTMEAVAKDKVARGAIADQALLGPERGGITPQEAMRQLKALPSIQTGFRERLKQLGQEGKLSTAGEPAAPPAPRAGAPAPGAPAPGVPAGVPSAYNPATKQRLYLIDGRWTPGPAQEARP